MIVTKTSISRKVWVGATVLAASSLVGMAAHGQTVLNAAFYSPPDNRVVILAREVFDEIEKETDGRVQFKVFPSATLVAAAEMGTAVDEGTAFMATWYMPYMSKTIPLFDIETVPVWGTGTCDAIVDTYENGLNDLYSRALELQHMPNVKVAGVAYCLPRVIGTTKHPVKVPGDVKGLRLRSVAAEADMLTGMGANPINMTFDQAYEALSRGILDGITNGFYALYQGGHLEILKYVVNTNLTPVLMHVIYNDKLLDKLDPKDREIVEKGMKRVAEHTRNGVTKVSDISVVEAPAKYGVTIHELDAEERKLWQTAANASRLKFEAKSDTDPLIKEGLSLVRKYNPVN